MKVKRLHDHIYLKENRYKKPKEMFKFIERNAFKSTFNKKKELICDIGCAAGEFLYFLKKEYPHKSFTGVDLRKDLLNKAKRYVSGVKFLKGSVLRKSLFYW